MKISYIYLLLSTAILSSSAHARTIENFNSRKGIPLDNIRSSLQNSCWTFHHFDISRNFRTPSVNDDGAMSADATALQFSNTGIYTPVLKVSPELEVSFVYAFSSDFSASAQRWIKICLADASNNIIQVLEKLELTGYEATRAKKYSTVFNNVTPGAYRLVLLYGGKGENASSISIDDINTSAPYKYEGGCNAAPKAIADNITGMPNRTAAGSVTANDSEINLEAMKAFLVKGSPDGDVQLKEDGTFVFHPRKNFTGKSTSFIYRICDHGQIALCSQDAVVNIRFPQTNLLTFNGTYKYEGNVELNWKTDAFANVQKFQVERSLDGRSWSSSGAVYAKSIVTDNIDYTYTDNVGKNTALKKDLYYRLKQVNADGTSSFSRLLVLRVYNTPMVSMISVTPDPGENDISINLELHEDAVISTKIFNTAGSTVLNKISKARAGFSTLNIEGSSGLVAGSYLLEVIVNSRERMLVRLVKE
jgi:hypothetical protein